MSSTLLTERRGLARGFDSLVYVREYAKQGDEIIVRDPGEDVTENALLWLRNRAEPPFFLFLHYYDAHSDLSPEPRYRQQFVRSDGAGVEGSTVWLGRARNAGRQLSPQQVAYLLDLYDAEIRQLDDRLAPLVAYLDDHGLRESTLVVVTSDHGEEFMEHGSLLHGRTYFEEVIHVPLILRGPGVPRGLRSDVLASGVDVTPTILGLLGVPPPPGLAGVDLAQAWADGGRTSQRFVLAGADEQQKGGDTHRMIRSERYKLVQDRSSGATVLFDLEQDPAERTDRSELNPRVAADLRERLEAEASGPERDARVRVSHEEDLLLRRLGYVE